MIVATVSVAKEIGGIPSLTAVLVISTGVFGAVIARGLLNLLRVKEVEARGFALGVASHGIGTARAFQVSDEMGAFAELGMGLNGVFTAFVVTGLVASFIALALTRFERDQPALRAQCRQRSR